MLKKIIILLLCLNNLLAIEKPGLVFPVSEYKRIPAEAKARKVMLVLPPIAAEDRLQFQIDAFNQIAEFLRKYDYIVPSYLEINHFLKKENIKPEDYPKSYYAIAEIFNAKKIFLLDIQKLSYLKKLNWGILGAGILVSGYGRYISSEYRLDIYDREAHIISSMPAIERNKDYTLGFFQTSIQLARKSQKQTLKSMLDRYAKMEIKQAKGYILEPLEKTFVDSKGFR